MERRESTPASGRKRESITEPQVSEFNGSKILKIPVGPYNNAWGFGAFTWREIMKELPGIKEANEKINAGLENYNDQPLIVVIESRNGQFPAKEIDLKNYRIQAIVKYADKIQTFLDERDREWKANRQSARAQ